MKMGYISCTLTFLNMTDDRFVQSYKSPAFHPKIRIVALQNVPENQKNVCSSVCKSQNVCPSATNVTWLSLHVGTLRHILLIFTRIFKQDISLLTVQLELIIFVVWFP